MKILVSKIAFIICLLVIIQPGICQAQKNCDLALSIVSPFQGEEIPYGDTIEFYVSIKNLGPDDIDSASETFVFGMKDVPLSTFFSDSNIPAGDSMVYMAFSFVNGEDMDTSFSACFYLRADTSTFVDNNQTNDTVCLDITLKAEENTGIGKVSNDKGQLFQLHPNPASTQVSLLIQLPQAAVYELVVQNILGNTVHRETLKANKGKNEFTLDVSRLSPGVYFVKTTNAQGSFWTKKLVVR